MLKNMGASLAILRKICLCLKPDCLVFQSCGIGYFCKTCKTKRFIMLKDCFLYESKSDEVITVMLCWFKVEEILDTNLVSSPTGIPNNLEK